MLRFSKNHIKIYSQIFYNISLIFLGQLFSQVVSWWHIEIFANVGQRRKPIATTPPPPPPHQLDHSSYWKQLKHLFLIQARMFSSLKTNSVQTFIASSNGMFLKIESILSVTINKPESCCMMSLTNTNNWWLKVHLLNKGIKNFVY